MTQLTANDPSIHFIGLDVGDRRTHACVLDQQREVVERFQFSSTEQDLRKAMGKPACKVVLEVGSQSPWMSACLSSMGHDVLVADARRVAAITRSGRKTDRRDAETLARLLQGMPELLGSVHHRKEDAQADLAIIKARDLLVGMRTKAILHVRGTVKTFGLRLSTCSSAAFHRLARTEIPEQLESALVPVLDQLDELQQKIRQYDRMIGAELQQKYPATQLLRAVKGVGPILSTAFVLIVDDPTRFEKSRTVGSWVGLCPRVQASGDRDPQLSISKTGCPYLRRLLVQGAHYIMGPFGEDCDLRRYGLRICERGGSSGRRRAVVAVARKLAVLLHRLWVSGDKYEPLRNAAPGPVTA